MINSDAEPIGNRPPRPKLNIQRLGWRKVITKEEVLDNLVKQPDPHFYDQCPYTDSWILKE